MSEFKEFKTDEVKAIELINDLGGDSHMENHTNLLCKSKKVFQHQQASTLFRLREFIYSSGDLREYSDEELLQHQRILKSIVTGEQGNMALLYADCCRIAYEAGQRSQQEKVEGLEKELESERAETVKGYSKISDLRLERDELQKRLESAQQEIFNCRVVGLGVIRTLDVVERALKGL